MKNILYVLKKWMIRLVIAVSSPLINISSSKIIAGTDKEAVYNPAAIIVDNSVVLLTNFRREPWERVFSEDKYFNSIDPTMLFLDGNLVPKRSQVLSFEGFNFPGLYRVEDFRLFQFGEHIYINYDLTTQPHAKSDVEHRKDIQVLSRLDIENRKIEFLGIPKIDIISQNIEKNWAYFEHNDELYLLYSLTPYRLLKMNCREGLNFETVIENKGIDLLPHSSGKHVGLCISSNPVKYNDKYYLVLCHLRNGKWPNCVYSHYAVLIDRESLMPVRICIRPILKGPGIRGKYKSIIYVMSAIVTDADVILFLGEGDTYSSYVRISKNELNTYFVSTERPLSKIAE